MENQNHQKSQENKGDNQANHNNSMERNPKVKHEESHAIPTNQEQELPHKEHSEHHKPHSSPLTQKIAQLENELKAAQEEKQRILRALADKENSLKIAEREKGEGIKFAVNNFSSDLIIPLDNLFRALETCTVEQLEADQLLSSLHKGVQMTKDEFLKTFSRYGVERVFPLNEKFDHNTHQAVSQQENNELEEGTILAVLQAGYTVQGRLIRPAMVVVSKKGQ